MTAPVTWNHDAEATLQRLRGRLFATVTEASVILSYDTQGRTVRKAIESGEIPATRVGGTWRIPVTWIRRQVRLDGDGSDNRAASAAPDFPVTHPVA